MDFHVLTDNGAVLICTVEGREVTIPAHDPEVLESPQPIDQEVIQDLCENTMVSI